MKKDKGKKLYLDNAATTALLPEVRDYVVSLLNNDIEYGNPSSMYEKGRKTSDLINEARKHVADFINADVNDIYFTSGGSASNTLAINGYIYGNTLFNGVYYPNNVEVLYSPTCHKSILECVGSLKHAYPLKVNEYGFINIRDLKEWLETSDKKCFVILEYANSEIGTIQFVKNIIDLVHYYNGIVYLDCTGSISQIPLDVQSLNIDMCGFSGHKIGSLKGIGVLYKKHEINLKPLIYGSQESGLIGGTENVIGIASIGKAVQLVDYDSITNINRTYVINYILKYIDDTYLIGYYKYRLPHNVYVCIKNVDAEALVEMMDINGIQISTGSACNNIERKPSPALIAIGLNKEDVYSCIRITFSGKETAKDLKYLCDTLKECVEQLRSLN